MSYTTAVSTAGLSRISSALLAAALVLAAAAPAQAQDTAGQITKLRGTVTATGWANTEPGVTNNVLEQGLVPVFGSSGIGWCFGRFDRPWGPERQIFGKLRYMSSSAAAQRKDLSETLRVYGEDSRQSRVA